MEVKLGNVTIEVRDFIEEKADDGKVWLYITDSEVKEADFDEFLSFFNQYVEKGNYFTTVFNGRSFHGRFGQIYYSKNNGICNMRLVFVTSQDDIREIPSGVVMNNGSYRNTRKTVAKNDLILSNLLSVLEEKGLLNSDELHRITTVDETSLNDKTIRMSAELDDLHKYLKAEYETLNDIRKKM
ncbi:TPA: hypothetical protein ROY01_005783 [Bacillus toyonensis]|nr:hypothetical protein [Bacillus toyonensis]